jgi:hypothetical protein
MAVLSVPNTTTFTLVDVVAVSGLTGATNLDECFQLAVDVWFDPLYKGDKSTLLNFRNYTVTIIPPAPELPVVTTEVITDIGNTSATGGGNVTSQGTQPVIARGICWSTTTAPTTGNTHTINGSGTGAFTSSLTGLTTGTTYYVRAYATSSVGTAYGNEVSFVTTSTAPLLHEWFLPSLQETLYMCYWLAGYLPLGLDYPLSEFFFWTSSENNASSAFAEYAKAPSYPAIGKQNVANMRTMPVRSFVSSTLYNIKDVGPKGGRIFWMNYSKTTRVSAGGSNYAYFECYPLPFINIAHEWSNVHNVLVGTAQGANTGKANTLAIVNATATSVAKLCYDLTL